LVNLLKQVQEKYNGRHPTLSHKFAKTFKRLYSKDEEEKDKTDEELYFSDRLTAGLSGAAVTDLILDIREYTGPRSIALKSDITWYDPKMDPQTYFVMLNN
jgi:hypothetical protein